MPTPEQWSFTQESYLYQWSRFSNHAQITASNVAAINAYVNTLSPFPGYGTGIQDVGSADANGTGTTGARVDHVHRGVHKITESVDAYGDVVLSGPMVAQSANTFLFSMVTSYHEYADPAANVPCSEGVYMLTSNSHGINFVLPAAVDNLGRWISVNTNYNSMVPVIGTGGDTVETSAGRGHVIYVSNGVDTWRNIMSINLP